MAALLLIGKILLWTLAALLALVALALFVPVTVELAADDSGFTARLRVLLVRVLLYPRPEKEPVKKRRRGLGRRPGDGGKSRPVPARPVAAEKQDSAAATSEHEPPASAPSQPSGGQPDTDNARPGAANGEGQRKPAGGNTAAPTRKKDGLADRLPKDLDRAAALAATAAGAVRRILAGLWVHDLCIYLPVHGDTAADTALKTGGIWASMGASMGVLQNFVRVRPGSIEVEPDYTGKVEKRASFSCKITGELFIMVLVGIWAFRRLREQKFL